MLFSLKLQRNNRQNALAMDSAKGKSGEKVCIFTMLWRWSNHILWQSHWKKPVFPLCCGDKTTTCYMTEPKYKIWLCLSLWLIQDSNWKGRVLWKLSGGLATILQNWISCNEQKMREAHITRRGINFYLLIFIEKNYQP